MLRVQLAVTAPLPFWLRFERGRLRRKRDHPAEERGDAISLQLFVDRVRARDRRLACLVTALSSSKRAWRSAFSLGALSYSNLSPSLVPDLTLVPRPHATTHVIASLAVRPGQRRGGATGNARVELTLRSDDLCAAARTGAQKLLQPALAALMPLQLRDDTFVSIWRP